MIWTEAVRPPWSRSGSLLPNQPAVISEWMIELCTGDDWYIGVQPALLHTRVPPSVSQACREARYIALQYLGVSKTRMKNDIRRWERDIPVTSVPWEVEESKDQVRCFRRKKNPIIIINVDAFSDYDNIAEVAPVFIFFSRCKPYQLNLLRWPSVDIGINHNARLTTKPYAQWPD
jgi:hypothetical protein